MSNRFCLGALLSTALAFVIAGCAVSQVNSITISPATQTVSTGQTANFTATGTYGSAKHLSSQDVTSQVTWRSSVPSVANFTSTGGSPAVVTAYAAGTTTITASMSGYGGTLTASATLTVTAGTGGTGGNLSTLTIIPGNQAVAAPNQTSQFLAIGTTSTGETIYETPSVLWGSSNPQVATICNAGSTCTPGVATGVAGGTTTITATYPNPPVSGMAAVTSSATFTVTSGSNPGDFTALSLTPTTQSVSATGQSASFVALGTIGSTGLEQDVTNYYSSPTSNITWTSSIPSVATVTSGLALTSTQCIGAPTASTFPPFPACNGVVTGVSAGTTTVTAKLTNSDGSVATASATVTVTATPAPEPLLSLSVVPASITVGNLQDTGNFLAIGTFSTAPNVRDLTNSVTWISSLPSVFPVSSNIPSTSNPTSTPGSPGGIVTAYGNGSAVIIAEATDATTGSIQTATATFSCPLVLPNPPATPGSCFEGSQAAALLATVTIYNEGLNTTDWMVTAPSATGTQDVIHCGPGWALSGGAGGSVCVATYPINASGTTVTLTATQSPGSVGTFGGWSSSCTTITPNPSTAAGPNTCSFTISPTSSPENTNITVGVIFN